MSETSNRRPGTTASRWGPSSGPRECKATVPESAGEEPGGPSWAGGTRDSGHGLRALTCDTGDRIQTPLAARGTDGTLEGLERCAPLALGYFFSLLLPSLPKPIKCLKEGGSEARVTSLLFVCPLLPLPLLSPLSISPLSLSSPSLFPGIQPKTLGDSMTPEPLACHAVNIPSQAH